MPASKTLDDRDALEPNAFVERGDQVELVERVIGAALEGEPVVLVVRGGHGTGKSRLQREVLTRARGAGFDSALIDGFSPHVPLLALWRLADELAIETQRVSGPVQLLRVVRAGIEARVGQGQPVALGFDDLQRCSADDLALIHDLVTRPPHGPLLLVLAVGEDRAGDQRLLPQLLADLLERPATHLLELTPFSTDEVAQLVQACPSLEAPSLHFLQDLHAVTGGHVDSIIAFLREIERMPEAQRAQVLSGSRALDALPLPSAIAERLSGRVDGLGAAELATLRALAVWKKPATIEEVATLAEAPTERVAAALEVLEERRLVKAERTSTELAFALSDRMLALLLQQEMPALTLRRLHERASGLLDRQPAPTEGGELATVAEHYVSGGGALDRRRVEVVLQAARWLNETSRYARTVELLGRLAARVDGGPLPEEADALLAEANARLGRWQEAEAILSRARPAAGHGDDAAEVLLRVARNHVTFGRDVDALRLYRTVLDDPDVSPRVRLRITEDVARVKDQLGEHAEARQFALGAAREAEERGELELAADIWVAHHSLLLDGGEMRESLRAVRHGLALARRSRSERVIARATSGVGNCLADLAPLPRSIRWLRRALARGQACGDSALVSWVAARLAAAYLETGEWEEARAAARLAVHTDVALHRIRSQQRTRATLAMLEALRGNRADAGLQLELVDASRPGPGASERAAIMEQLAFFELAVAGGDHGEALARIKAIRSGLRSRPGWLRALLVEVFPREASVRAALRDAAGARRVQGEFERASEGTGEPPTPLVSALRLVMEGEALAAEGDSDRALSVLGEAREDLGRLGYRWRQAMAAYRSGEIRAARGDEEGAATDLSAAFAHFRAMGATPATERVRHALRAIGRQPPRDRNGGTRGPITRREWQVLRLAAQGLRDAEIAKALWISPRTVTTHMHNILSKLGLHSRLELAGWLAEQGQTR